MRSPARHMAHVEHQTEMCWKCRQHQAPFPAKPDHPKWLRFKLKDASWKQWRKENPKEVKAMREQLAAQHGDGG
jgi:hypothetical protein